MILPQQMFCNCYCYNTENRAMLGSIYAFTKPRNLRRRIFTIPLTFDNVTFSALINIRDLVYIFQDHLFIHVPSLRWSWCVFPSEATRGPYRFIIDSSHLVLKCYTYFQLSRNSDDVSLPQPSIPKVPWHGSPDFHMYEWFLFNFNTQIFQRHTPCRWAEQ